MTVTATRVPTLLPDVPAGVTVITAQEIAARGYVTLAQALGAVPGLGVVQAGGPGGQTSVFIRGTNSEDIQVLIDGVPVNDPSVPNGAFNFGEDTLADIARIEIVRGPMSGLYGSGAIGGVINLITLQGAGAPKLAMTAGGGWPAQGLGSASVSGATGPYDYALTGEINQQAGFDDTARRLSVYDGHRDPFRSWLGSGNFGYTPVAGTRVYAVIRARQSDSAEPDLGYPIYDDPNDYTYDTNLFGKLGIRSHLLQGLLTTELFVARLQDDRHYKNLLDLDDPNLASADDHYHGYRTDVQWNNTVHVPDAGVAEFSSVLFGVEYIDDRAKENVDDGSGFGPYIATVNASQHAVAGHVGAQTRLFGRLTLTAAVRDDAVSSFGSAVTGRVGAVLAIPAADLHLKAAYGTGFLAPSLFDLHGVDNTGYAGNPDLKAEHSSSYEAGGQFDVPAFGQIDFASISAAYFDTHINDLINFYYTSPDYSSGSEQNIGKARINGVETELVLTLADWAVADLTYTYTNARNGADNTQLLRRPESTGAATLTLTPTPRISITPQVQYVGRFQDYLYGDDGLPTGTGTAEPGTIVNVTASYQIKPGLGLFVEGKNLFESKFEPVNGLQIPGQSLLLGVRAVFQ